MSPEVLQIAQSPILLAALSLAAGILMGMTIEQMLSDRRRKAWREKYGWNWPKPIETTNISVGPWSTPARKTELNYRDAADQLRIVMGAEFTSRRVLNLGEARVFKELDRIVLGCNPDWQVMAQVSLGEVLSSKDSRAYSCINSKRVDLLLMDGDCRPRHAIEYQGAAHHQGTAAARDAVKKEALRRAGIGYHEVVAGHTTPAELRQLIEKLVNRADSGTEHSNP